jgi:hypothetical protein
MTEYRILMLAYLSDTTPMLYRFRADVNKPQKSLLEHLRWAACKNGFRKAQKEEVFERGGATGHMR